MMKQIFIAFSLLTAPFLSAGKFDVGYGMHNNEVAHEEGTLAYKDSVKIQKVRWQKIKYKLDGIELTALFPAKPFLIDSKAFVFTHIFKWTYYQFQPFRNAPDTVEGLIKHYQATPGVRAVPLEKFPKGCSYAIAFERIEEDQRVATGVDYVFGDVRFCFMIEGQDVALADTFFQSIHFHKLDSGLN